MWPRHAEITLGLWLVTSPFVFRHDPADRALWIMDLAAGTLIVTLSLSSYWAPLRRLHLVLLPVAAGLAVSGWLASRADPAAAAQNHVVVGLLLAMFAIIPGEAAAPPVPWREVGAGLDDPPSMG